MSVTLPKTGNQTYLSEKVYGGQLNFQAAFAFLTDRQSMKTRTTNGSRCDKTSHLYFESLSIAFSHWLFPQLFTKLLQVRNWVVGAILRSAGTGRFLTVVQGNNHCIVSNDYVGSLI